MVYYNRFCTDLGFVVQQKQRKQLGFGITKCELILLLIIRGVACRRNIESDYAIIATLNTLLGTFMDSNLSYVTRTHVQCSRSAKRAISAPRIFRQMRLSSSTFYSSNATDAFKCRHKMRIKW